MSAPPSRDVAACFIGTSPPCACDTITVARRAWPKRNRHWPERYGLAAAHPFAADHCAGVASAIRPARLSGRTAEHPECLAPMRRNGALRRRFGIMAFRSSTCRAPPPAIEPVRMRQVSVKLAEVRARPVPGSSVRRAKRSGRRVPRGAARQLTDRLISPSAVPAYPESAGQDQLPASWGRGPAGPGPGRARGIGVRVRLPVQFRQLLVPMCPLSLLDRVTLALRPRQASPFDDERSGRRPFHPSHASLISSVPIPTSARRILRAESSMSWYQATADREPASRDCARERGP